MKSNQKKLIAEIVPAVKLPRDVAQIFSYAVPEKMEREIKTGMIVEVPFRKKNILGVVLSVKKEKPENIKFKLKEIGGLPKEDLKLLNQQIQLAEFVSNYYYTPLSLVVKTIVPPITKNKPRKEIELRDFSSQSPPAGQASPAKRLRLDKTNKLLKKIEKGSKILLIHNLRSERHNLYFNLIKSILKKNEQALILFPESFDICNFTKFYSDKFGKDKIAVLTSELTKNQYSAQWEKTEDGSAKIIIGTRQAVFAPFKNLKLIIADDEHNSSYKQWDMNPRYHGIKVAEKLAEIWKAKIILSSQAPSVESYYGVKNKMRFKLFKNSLSVISNEAERSEKSKNSTISALSDFSPTARNDNFEIVNLNTEQQKGNYSVLSEDLQNSLLENIYKRKQAIIFIPRLGNNTITQCKDCNWIAECKNCGATLVSYANYLYCQKCREKIGIIKKCPKCAGQNVISFGYGSEKIEKEIEELFKNKNIKISRLDSDIASNKSKQFKIYKDFINKKIDVLIGTQMVLKNWDLKNLALTAVLFPEIIFNQPEFNSREKSFQFLMSIYNKSSKNHRIIIQTHKPDNDLFRYILRQAQDDNDVMVSLSNHSVLRQNQDDMLTFYSDEIENRKTILKNGIGYPPFAQLIKLIYKDFNPQKCENEADLMYKILQEKISKSKTLKANFEIIKPFSALNYKEFGKYRWNIIIKSDCKDIKSRNLLLNCVKKDWIVDIDPDGIL